MSRAAVVVLIPHHRDPDGIARSLASIDEPFPVDVLVVDDGSPVPPDERDLRDALAADGAVHLEVLPTNRGIAGALNHGLRWCWDAGYPYIARLDAGDRNHSGRLAAQLEALERDPRLGVVGAWAQAVQPDGGDLFTLSPPTDHEALVRALTRRNPMVHPTLVFRAQILRDVGGYPEDLPSAEDYGLIATLASRTRIGNVGRVLVDYEIDPGSISSTRRREQVRSRLRVITTLDAPWWSRGLGVLRNLALLAAPRGATTAVKRRLGRQR